MHVKNTGDKQRKTPQNPQTNFQTMNVTTIKDINDSCSNGQVLDCIKVQILDTYEHRSVATKNGQTTVQNVKLKDDTGFIFAALWGQNDASQYKGQSFFIKSKQTNRGMAGVTVADKPDKTGAIKRGLNISASAIVQPVVAGGAGQTAAAPATQSSGKSQPSTSVGLEELANFWEHCYVAAHKRQAKFGFGDDIKQSCAASLFIQGIRDGVHFSQTSPAPWASVVPAGQFTSSAQVAGVIEAGLSDGPAGADEDCPF